MAKRALGVDEQARGHEVQEDPPDTIGVLRGFATYILPLIFLFFVIEPTLSRLMPAEWFNTRTLHLFNPSGKEFELFARDIDGRMNFSVFSAAIFAASIGAIFYSSFVVYRRFSGRGAWVIIGLALLIGIAICKYGGGGDSIECPKITEPAAHRIATGFAVGFRAVVLDDIICVAEREKKTAPGALVTMRNMIFWNSFAGFAAASAVMAALATLAVGGGRRPVVNRLQHRLNAFKILTLIGSMLFVLNALITKALVGWAQALLDPADAGIYEKLSHSLLNYWAAQTSAILFVTLVCASAGIRAQIDNAADAEIKKMPEGEAPGVIKWKQDNGLTFDLPTVMSATIATIAPLLAGPAADFVAAVTKAVH